MKDWIYQHSTLSALPPDVVLMHTSRNLATAIGATWRPVGDMEIEAKPGPDMLSTHYTVTQKLELVPVGQP